MECCDKFSFKLCIVYVLATKEHVQKIVTNKFDDVFFIVLITKPTHLNKHGNHKIVEFSLTLYIFYIMNVDFL